jgi:integrase
MRVHLTDRFCAHAKSTEPQTDFVDDTVTGLALRVTSGGTKSWTLTWGTPRRRATLGRYPSMSLARARTAAIETREGRTSGTVAALAEVYLQACNGKRSAPEIERRLRRDVLPIIGHIPLRELHRRDITRVIDAKSSAPIAARRAFEDIRAMIRFAVSRGDLDHNPIDGMVGPPISKPRTRTLTDDEIRTLWLSLDRVPADVGQVIKLCLVTGQRLGEITGIQRNELDLAKATWNLPGARTKNGHPHSVPLSPLALNIIEVAIANAAGSVVFESPKAKRMAMTIQRAGISAGAGISAQAGWTPHDLRRTALTRMAELGVPPIVLGHIANHRTTTKAGITLGVYVQHAYEREKRQALELWADRLKGIIDGSSKVIAIRR